MPTYTNKSSAVFHDGDIIIAPGESLFTEEQFRIDQFTGEYAWQFSENNSDKKANDVPTEAEAKEEGPQKGIREINASQHVQLDENGAQAEVVGSPEPAK